MSGYDFVIITPGRSGSDHLSETLKGYDDITVAGEIYNQSNDEQDSFNRFISSSKVRSIIGLLFNRQKLAGRKINYPLKYLGSKFLHLPILPTSAVHGFKLTLDQLNAYPFLLDKIKANRVKIIYLYREDRLAQVLSLIKARKTGVYQTTATSPTSSRTEFDPQIVKNQYYELIGWENDLLELLKTDTFLKLTYETLFSHYEDKLDQIREFLGLAKAPLPIFSSYKKLNKSNLSEWVNNLEDIKAALNELT